MKTTILSAVFALTAGVLFASETNFYYNPEFKSKTDKKGKLTILDHWYEGKVSFDGKYEGSPVIRIEQVKVNWGGFNCTVISSYNPKRALKPGKYVFTVWCKPESVTSSVYLFRFVQPAGKKRIRFTRAYRGGELPPVGKWTELVMNFEIKPGDTGNSVGFAAYSATPVGPKTVLFAKPRITCESEE